MGEGGPYIPRGGYAGAAPRGGGFGGAPGFNQTPPDFRQLFIGGVSNAVVITRYYPGISRILTC